MTISPAELEALEIQLAEVIAWRKANRGKLGTLEYRKSTLARRTLIDLVRAGGGTPQMRARAAQKLKKVEDGTHLLLKKR